MRQNSTRGMLSLLLAIVLTLGVISLSRTPLVLASPAVPNPPTELWTENQTNPTNITDFTPEFSAIFTDNDVGDNAENMEIWIGNSTGWVTPQAVTAENEYLSFYATNTIDDNFADASVWKGSSYPTTDWISWDMGSIKWIGGVRVYILDAVTSKQRITLIENSTDNTNWNTIWSGIWDTGQGGWFSKTWDAIEARYIRVTTESLMSPYRTEFKEADLEIYDNVWESGWIDITAIENNTRSQNITFEGTLVRGITYYWKCRFMDIGGITGAWSAETATFKINQLPITENLKTEGFVNPENVYTLTPFFSWVYSDPDGDNQSNWQIQVGTSEYDNNKWDYTGTETDTSDVYAGTTLFPNVTYYVRVRTKDNLEWSSWSNGTFKKISLVVIENIYIEGENLVIDRDRDFESSNATDNITIWIQASDSDGATSLENETCLITLKDKDGNMVIEDENISDTYDNIDENTAKWYYIFDPLDDVNIGSVFVEVYVEDNWGGYDSENAENLFKVDDKLIVINVDASQYEELSLLVTISANLISDNSVIENQQLTVWFYNPNNENRKQFTENTNENGEISINTILINEILGGWTITAEMDIGENDNLDGFGSANFDLSGALCRLIAVTPSDTSITGTISSKIADAAELHLMVRIYDVEGTQLVEKTETYNVGAGEQYRWEIPYGIALSEGTYSYSVRLWNYDYSNQYDSIYAEVHISIAVSSASTTDWYVSSTLLIENIYNISLAREFIVTNPANITKQNYLFREAVPAPYGSLAIVNIGGIHELTKTVDNVGTISHTFDVPHDSQRKISITSTIWGALSYEKVGAPFIVTHYHMGQPILVEKHTCKVKNILNFNLYDAEIELPYDNVIRIIDSDGRGYNFWAGGSTWVKIPHFDADSTIEFEVLTAISEDLLNKLSRMLGRSTYGIPVLLLVSISAIASAIVMHLWSRKTKVKTGTLQLLTLIGLPFFAAILLLVI